MRKSYDAHGRSAVSFRCHNQVSQYFARLTLMRLDDRRRARPERRIARGKARGLKVSYFSTGPTKATRRKVGIGRKLDKGELDQRLKKVKRGQPRRNEERKARGRKSKEGREEKRTSRPCCMQVPKSCVANRRQGSCRQPRLFTAFRGNSLEEAAR